MILRGVNLGGDSKVPFPDGGTQYPSDFGDHRSVSFIGRPFPIAEADDHLARIAHWGFNTLRLLTTWEAVEHAGPGLYDTEYLDFFAQVVRRAGDHGLYVFVDFHQDAWSRMSGGDGAPGWTFEAVGLDFSKFGPADAAHVMQARYDYASEEARQEAYPQMSWGSNYRLPANAIMWSLFWGGRLFAPQFEIDGVNIQDFLQDRFLGSMNEVARRIADCPNVLGFDTMNEPGLGWMGMPLSYRHVAASEAMPDQPRIGPAFSPLDGLAIAQGMEVTVPILVRDSAGAAVPDGERTYNSNRVSIWQQGAQCPFEAAGAYRREGDRLVALDEDHFRASEGRLLAMPEDGFGPFFHKVAATVGAHDPGWAVFSEMDPFAHVSGRHFPAGMPKQAVNACHWYDLGMLYLKAFDPAHHFDAISGDAEQGLKQIGDRYRRQLADLASEAENFSVAGAPTMIGEFGIPFDLNHGEAFGAWARGERSQIWLKHEQALTLMYDAMDTLQLHSAQWNYTASNRNDARVGDNWNQEDLSIFSTDQREDANDPDAGGRAVAGFCRPYARRIQGDLCSIRFDRASGLLRVEFLADPAVGGTTEIYVPTVQYPDGFIVRFEGVPAILNLSPERQLVTIEALDSGPASLVVFPAA